MPSILHHSNKLYYEKHGSGEKVILLFHGFGQSLDVLIPIVLAQPNAYTYYLFDAPYHGKSTRRNSKFSVSEWVELFQQFLDSEGVQKFSLVGYSLGGRFALTTSYFYTPQINQLFLVAPDGIYKNRWYKLGTGIGKFTFKYLMKNPTIFFKILDKMDGKNWVHPSLIKFARQELGPKENRIRVYQSWVYLKPLGIKKSSLVKRFNEHQLKIAVLLGSKDNIIPPKRLVPLFKKIPTATIEIQPLKHHQLVEEMMHWIK